MEARINVAAILKDKPQGTKLYADAFGELSIEEICTEDELGIILLSSVGDRLLFYNDGKYNMQGEPILVPSKLMHDWSKFAWKKGDVLKNTAYEERVIFDGFLNDDYTYFKGKHPLDCSNKLNITYHEECNCFTGNYRLESEDAAQTYIKTIEEKLGGKLNRQTLKIEKAQPEFKDGDIVTQGVLKGVNVCIIKNCIDKIDNKYNYYAIYNTQDKEIDYDDWSYISPFAKFATDSEKQQLFDALAKEGKAWDAETKTLEDLPKKCEFKPFDKVLVRNTDTEEWFPGFFEKFDSTWNYPYHIMNRRSMTDFAFKQCIPYEGNEHLLGTTKDVEG